MDVSSTGLRVLREVAERGSFTAAATALGYTQSAVSRQVAALEREAGRRLFTRGPAGVRPTAAGAVLLRHAATALDALEAAGRELAGAAPVPPAVRLGAFTLAAAVLVPPALAALRATQPGLEIRTREGTTPALVRALRAGSLDLALLAQSPPFRPPAGDGPPLELEPLAEHPVLVGVAARHPLAGAAGVTVADLAGLPWVASRSTPGETLLGVWPGLPGRPRVAHVAQDWLTKLQLVAAGCGVTAVPAFAAPALPPGVVLLPVLDGPREQRRLVLARRPGDPPPPVTAVATALHRALT